MRSLKAFSGLSWGKKNRPGVISIDPPHQTAVQRHIPPFDQQPITRLAILILEPQPPSVGIR
jgi:hypothetical protein